METLDIAVTLSAGAAELPGRVGRRLFLRRAGAWHVQADDAKLVLSLYDDIVGTTALESSLTSLARRFSCESASIISFDPATPQTSVAVAIGALDQIRYHLKTAFARTGTRSQSRLMQLVTRVLTEFRG